MVTTIELHHLGSRALLVSPSEAVAGPRQLQDVVILGVRRRSAREAEDDVVDAHLSRV